MSRNSNKTARNLFLLAVLFLTALYFFPLWSISLGAPQYPQELTLYIWINKITGDQPGTLQNINILNHYVGMKKIVPDSIPELNYFQYVVTALILFGFLFGYFNNRKLVFTWIIIFALLSIIGIYDFYLWEYDFGHNLDPRAPIQLGQDYQPPLFGRRTILNFDASSYPSIGGIFMGLSLILSSFACLKMKTSS